MTDVLQSIVMLGSMFALSKFFQKRNSWYEIFSAIFIYSDLGVTEVFETNAEANGFQMRDFTFDTSQRTSSIGYIFF